MGRITHGFTHFHHEIYMNTRASTLNLRTDISSNTHLILNRLNRNSTLLSLPVNIYYHLFYHNLFKVDKLKQDCVVFVHWTLDYQKTIAFQPSIPQESLSEIRFMDFQVYLHIATSKCCKNVHPSQFLDLFLTINQATLAYTSTKSLSID